MISVKIKAIIEIIAFIARNLRNARKLAVVEGEVADGLVFRGYWKSDANSISKIYSQLNDGAVFSNMQRWLFGHIGGRCLFVVEQHDATGESRIVGANMYYFNKRDVQENTIHEGFVGVVPEMNGRGIATKLRSMAFAHFKSAGRSGMSTRISLNNSASLVSAKKMGFQPIEEYKEPSTGEKRYYMVCKF